MSYEGKVVLNYKLTKKLGEGGFGAVYLAEQVDLGRRAAIKILHHQFATQPAVVERFFREARAVCEIGHRAIIAIENFGKLPETDEPFYLMEFFPGGSLTQITSERWLTSEQLVSIFDPIAEALSAAHAKGIVHRDLKPDNIMVRIASDRVADVRLLDFGIAKLLDGDDSKSLTGGAMGTPSYMPPEQALDAKSIDVRADVYSFGATIYAAVCGRPPFDGSSIAAILLAVQSETAPLLSTKRPDVTPELDAAIRRCLAKQRDHRPGSIDNAWSAIRAEVLRANLSAKPVRPDPIGPPVAAHDTPAPMAVATPVPAASPQITRAAPLRAVAPDQAPTTPEVRAKTKLPLVLGGLGLVATFAVVAVVVAKMSGGSTEPAGSGTGSATTTAIDAAPPMPDAAVATNADAATTARRPLERDVVTEIIKDAADSFAQQCRKGKPVRPKAPTVKLTFRVDVDAEGAVTSVGMEGTASIAECIRKLLAEGGLRIRASTTGGNFVATIQVPVDAVASKPPDPTPPDPKPPDPKPPGAGCSEAAFAAGSAKTGPEVDALLARLNACQSKLDGGTFTRLQQALVRRKLEL